MSAVIRATEYDGSKWVDEESYERAVIKIALLEQQSIDLHAAGTEMAEMWEKLREAAKRVCNLEPSSLDALKELIK